MRTTTFIGALGILATSLALAACSGNSEPKKPPRPTRPESVKAEAPASAPAVVAAGAPDAAPAAAEAFPAIGNPEHLPNAHRVTQKILSGGQPEGDEAFKDLAAMGVKTIISVDGAAPDVESAKKYGLRYVHLPITYGGVPAERAKELAKAVEELPGPMYIHCHHGKHRSAAAVAVACVMAGELKPEQAESVLQTFGTGVDYKGLWRDAREAWPMDPQALTVMKVNYVERAKIPAVAEAMVQIDHTFDDLKLIQKAGWRTPANHPALDAPHVALQVREMLHEVGRTVDTAKRPADYQRLLKESEAAALALEDGLRAWKPLSANAGAQPPATLETSFKALTASCTACHKAHRN